MPSISLRLTPAEHRILVAVARQYGGNLTDAFRALLQKESITNELRAEFALLIEAQDKRASELVDAVDQVIKNQSDAAVALKHNFGLVSKTRVQIRSATLD